MTVGGALCVHDAHPQAWVPTREALSVACDSALTCMSQGRDRLTSPGTATRVTLRDRL